MSELSTADSTRAAMYLHDQAIQRLFGIGMSLSALRQHIPSGEALDRFDEVMLDIEAAADEVRAAIRTLKCGQGRSAA